MRPLPPVLEVILRPDRRRPDPPTLEVDMRRVFLIGMAVWALALVVCVVLWRTDVIGTTPVWSCVAGLALGVVGLVWERLGGSRR